MLNYGSDSTDKEEGLVIRNDMIYLFWNSIRRRRGQKGIGMDELVDLIYSSSASGNSDLYCYH